MKARKISKFGPYHHQPKSICPCASEKLMYNAVKHSSAFIFDRIFFIFAGNEDNYKVSDVFEIRPDLTGLRSQLPLSVLKISISWQKSCEHSSSYIFYSIIFNLAGNRDMYKSLNKFEFRPDITTYSRVTCP